MALTTQYASAMDCVGLISDWGFIKWSFYWRLKVFSSQNSPFPLVLVPTFTLWIWKPFTKAIMCKLARFSPLQLVWFTRGVYEAAQKKPGKINAVLRGWWIWSNPRHLDFPQSITPVLASLLPLYLLYLRELAARVFSQQLALFG